MPSLLPKRPEKGIQRSCLTLLQIKQNQGKVVWYDRLNSGSILIRGKNHIRRIRLCKEGTPDIYAILPDGHVLWVETKAKGGELSPEQSKFKEMISKVDGHSYHIIRDEDELNELIK